MQQRITWFFFLFFNRNACARVVVQNSLTYEEEVDASLMPPRQNPKEFSSATNFFSLHRASEKKDNTQKYTEKGVVGMSTTTRISEHRDYYHDDQENKEKENKEEKKKTSNSSSRRRLFFFVLLLLLFVCGGLVFFPFALLQALVFSSSIENQLDAQKQQQEQQQ